MQCIWFTDQKYFKKNGRLLRAWFRIQCLVYTLYTIQCIFLECMYAVAYINYIMGCKQIFYNGYSVKNIYSIIIYLIILEQTRSHYKLIFILETWVWLKDFIFVFLWFQLGIHIKVPKLSILWISSNNYYSVQSLSKTFI